MSAFLRDDFTGSGAIGTPNWVKNSYDPLAEGLSKYVQAGGFLEVSATPSTYAMYNGVPPTADYYAEGSVRFAAAANGQTVSLGLRGANVANGIHGYYAELSWVDATHVGVIISAYGGTQLNGSGFVNYVVAVPTNFVAHFSIVGSTLTLLLDSVQVWTGTSTLFTAAGVPWMTFNYGVAATDVKLDYFEAGNLTAPAFWTDFVDSAET